MREIATALIEAASTAARSTRRRVRHRLCADAGHQPGPVRDPLLRFRRRPCPARARPADGARAAADRLAITDINGYLPTHISERSQPQSDDPGVERRILPQPPQLHRRRHPPRDRQRQGGDARHLRMELGEGRYLPVKNVFVPLYVKAAAGAISSSPTATRADKPKGDLHLRLPRVPLALYRARSDPATEASCGISRRQLRSVFSSAFLPSLGGGGGGDASPLCVMALLRRRSLRTARHRRAPTHAQQASACRSAGYALPDWAPPHPPDTGHARAW
jgi:hypothetical protein